MNIYTVNNKAPKFLGKSYFVAPNASVIGDVEIGDEVSIWFGAVIRGDITPIKIGAKTNIQDNCVLHEDYDIPLTVGDNVTVGHGVILHGCTIASNCLIGMGAIILNNAKIEENCIIGAGALITQNKIIPPNSLVIGSPAKVIRQVTAEEIELIQFSAKHYVEQMLLYK
jgi:carbonic anhydrase/acetyltransferase-like protein (isoleucine patch superfamily)